MIKHFLHFDYNWKYVEGSAVFYGNLFISYYEINLPFRLNKGDIIFISRIIPIKDAIELGIDEEKYQSFIDDEINFIVDYSELDMDNSGCFF